MDQQRKLKRYAFFVIALGLVLILVLFIPIHKEEENDQNSNLISYLLPTISGCEPPDDPVTPTPAPPSTPPTPPPPTTIAVSEIIDMVEPSRMDDSVEHLAATIGMRVAGTDEERLAGEWLAQQLESYGYVAHISDPFFLDNGLSSRNVWAELPGENEQIMVIGAHYDSKPPAPGGNDNGSGCAVILEMARILNNTVPPYTIHFVFFGAEEIIDGNRDHHHYGSRDMAADTGFRSRIYSMTSIDMVGVGTSFWVDNMRSGPDHWRSYLYDRAELDGLPINTGETRAWSDHEPFGYNGVPCAWVHWRYDSEYHKATDVADRVDPNLLDRTIATMLRGVLMITGETEIRLR